MFDLDIIDKIDKYEVNNLEECLALCAKLREKDNLPHRIFIKESSYLKSFEFPYSNFFIEGTIEISNSLYGNKLDDEGVKLTTWRTATLKIKGNKAYIEATIVCNKDTHKAIIIGHHGKKLQSINLSASKDISIMLHKRVIMSLFVKVEEDWINKNSKLFDLGYFIGDKYDN